MLKALSHVGIAVTCATFRRRYRAESPVGGGASGRASGAWPFEPSARGDHEIGAESGRDAKFRHCMLISLAPDDPAGDWHADADNYESDQYSTRRLKVSLPPSRPRPRLSLGLLSILSRLFPKVFLWLDDVSADNGATSFVKGSAQRVRRSASHTRTHARTLTHARTHARTLRCARARAHAHRWQPLPTSETE